MSGGKRIVQKKGYSSPVMELIRLTTSDVLAESLPVNPTEYELPIYGRRFFEEDINGDGLNEYDPVD